LQIVGGNKSDRQIKKWDSCTKHTGECTIYMKILLISHVILFHNFQM
jgi:hypothetical protein